VGRARGAPDADAHAQRRAVRQKHGVLEQPKHPVGVQLLTVAVITVGLIGLGARMFGTTE
jgi:hypothetical protein